MPAAAFVPVEMAAAACTDAARSIGASGIDIAPDGQTPAVEALGQGGGALQPKDQQVGAAYRRQ